MPKIPDPKSTEQMTLNEAIALTLISIGKDDASDFIYWSRSIKKVIVENTIIRNFDRPYIPSEVDDVLNKIYIADDGVYWNY